MGVGIFNVIMGSLAIAGAFYGFSLIGTNSQLALGVLGGVILALGIFQIIRSRRTTSTPTE
jgi:hypothetical protein